MRWLAVAELESRYVFLDAFLFAVGEVFDQGPFDGVKLFLLRWLGHYVEYLSEEFRAQSCYRRAEFRIVVFYAVDVESMVQLQEPQLNVVLLYHRKGQSSCLDRVVVALVRLGIVARGIVRHFSLECSTDFGNGNRNYVLNAR